MHGNVIYMYLGQHTADMFISYWLSPCHTLLIILWGCWTKQVTITSQIKHTQLAPGLWPQTVNTHSHGSLNCSPIVWESKLYRYRDYT